MHQNGRKPFRPGNPSPVVSRFRQGHPWSQAEDFRPPFSKRCCAITPDPRGDLVGLADVVFAAQAGGALLRGHPAAGDRRRRRPSSAHPKRALRPAQEARQWLAAKAPTAEWLAVDDAPGNWPTRPRLVLTDFKRVSPTGTPGACGMLDAFRAGPASRGLTSVWRHPGRCPAPATSMPHPARSRPGSSPVFDGPAFAYSSAPRRLTRECSDDAFSPDPRRLAWPRRRRRPRPASRARAPTPP